jgi:glycosyltransferase involved in cell wall biosynthesis
MRITALVKDREHVCCRYRVNAFRSCLEAAGHRLDVVGWPGFWPSRLLLYHQLRHADVLLLQRKLLPAWQLRLLRRRVQWLVYDFDDAVFLRNSYSPRGHDSAARSRRFDEMVRNADIVVAGNEFLRHQAMAVADPGRVWVIPTCVDAARYPLALHEPDRKPVQLIWVGSASTIRGLEQLAPILEDLGRTGPRLQLKIICDRSLSLHHLPVQFCPWREAAEPEEIADADVGISWLPDDPWSRGKCGLKVLQYMAAGLPVVANAVGVQAGMVRHGETGFLVETAAQWHEAICRLAADAGLRRRMGCAGRRCVEAEYDIPVGAARWLDLLDGLQRNQGRWLSSA